MSLRASFQRIRALRTPISIRSLSTSHPLTKQAPPTSPQPDTNAKKNRTDTPNTDAQSTASKDEHKTGDDHPAKQPDQQAEPSRSTGFGGQTEVKEGKEGLGARGDKQSGWDPETERKRGEGVATGLNDTWL